MSKRRKQTQATRCNEACALNEAYPENARQQKVNTVYEKRHCLFKPFSWLSLLFVKACSLTSCDKHFFS